MENVAEASPPPGGPAPNPADPPSPTSPAEPAGDAAAPVEADEDNKTVFSEQTCLEEESLGDVTEGSTDLEAAGLDLDKLNAGGSSAAAAGSGAVAAGPGVTSSGSTVAAGLSAPASDAAGSSPMTSRPGSAVAEAARGSAGDPPANVALGATATTADPGPTTAASMALDGYDSKRRCIAALWAEVWQRLYGPLRQRLYGPLHRGSMGRCIAALWAAVWQRLYGPLHRGSQGSLAAVWAADMGAALGAAACLRLLGPLAAASLGSGSTARLAGPLAAMGCEIVRALFSLQASVDRLDLPGRNTLWFNQMQSMHSHGTRTLSWHGISLRHAAYSMVSLCPKKKISKFLKAISLGAVRAPVDGRSLNIAKPKPKRDDCNVFFSFLYENLSEPLALARDQVEDEEVAEEESYNVERIEAPQWLLEQDFLEVPIELGHVAAGSADKRLVEKRWLPTMSLAEIYDLYKDMHCDHAELSSWSSFSRAWKDWQQIIAIRPAQVHARCDDCAKYAKYRQLHCDNEADLKAVTNAYNKHIKEVFADRHVMTLLENKVEQSMKQGEQELPHLVLVIDGMDKSKWLLPKLVENTKRMSMLRRPSLHLVGVMIPGVLEFMAILEPDVKGDSDCQQTLICRAIQLAEEQLLRSGRSLPGRLVIQFDNTSKEGRNSQMLLWSSMMIKMKRFTDIAFGLMRVGHTHNRLDQRFGVISALLRRASCLETAEDYQAYILEHYKPARGLPLICEVITACHCWRDLMAPLETAFTGITGSKTTADAAHVMRVVARKDVAHCVPGCVAEEGDDFDPVLLAKHWLCSKVLSQPPTVQLEGKAKVDLSLLRTMPAPRAWLTDESLKKYAKTAEEVLQKPWQLHAAFSYFQDWLRRNGEQIPGKLPDIECIINGRDFLEPTGPEVTATWKDFAPEGALAIREVRARPKTYGPKRPPKTDGSITPSSDDGAPGVFASFRRCYRYSGQAGKTRCGAKFFLTRRSCYCKDPSGGGSGDPHIQSLRGAHYSLLKEGTFLAWSFSKAPVEWQLYAHYAGSTFTTQGLLLLDKSLGRRMEMTAEDCQWRSHHGEKWHAVSGGLELPWKVQTTNLTTPDLVVMGSEISFSMEGPQGQRKVARLLSHCTPHDHLDFKLTMYKKEDIDYVDGELGVDPQVWNKSSLFYSKSSQMQMRNDLEFEASETWANLGGSEAAAEYLKKKQQEQAGASLVLRKDCATESEIRAATKICAKYLKKSLNEDVFADCVFDVCHGGGVTKTTSRTT
ncbi:unnamed protein product [Durusdinium trenchii]|uniref:DUF7869 domain-containing protein n=1 Tax=Durusdinium trenchii TaxID=1381693 RepID=A0ABP0R8N5_9DINO